MPVFDNSLRGYSPFAYALFSSAKDFILQNNETTEDDRSFNFMNMAGDVFVPLTKRYFRMEIQNGSFPNFAPIDDPVIERIGEMEEFIHRYVSNEIVSFPVVKEMDLYSILIDLAKEKKVYGVVFESTYYSDMNSKKFLFNPLHPLNAFLLISGALELPPEGKLHIFEWKSRGLSQANAKLSEEKEKKYKEDYVKLFTLLESAPQEKITKTQTASISIPQMEEIASFPFIDAIDPQITVHAHQRSSAYENTKSLIVPAQLAISSIVRPFYGIILIERGERGRGTSGITLSPMKSGNISNPFREDTPASYQESLEYGSLSVCTGSESNISKKGWFTLSKVNLNSMFFQNIIDLDEAPAWATVSKKMAGEIFETAKKEEEERKNSESE